MQEYKHTKDGMVPTSEGYWYRKEDVEEYGLKKSRFYLIGLIVILGIALYLQIPNG